ncbi:MAG: response regulator [Cyanobacteria bacterium REEB67]|nr:response regulator [Cyanobacteria bacterium REEB67]
MESCLDACGHRVTIITSFSQAKKVLDEERCDLIISDVHLENGGNVFDFLRWVKDDFSICDIPFIFLSVEPSELAKYLSDGLRISARLLGAAKYISMDRFDANRLADEISEFLEPRSEAGFAVLPSHKGD